VSEPQDPSAAVISRDEPDMRTFEALVKDHFLVRTRSDAEGVEARDDNMKRASTALESGATIVATDYPVPDPEIGPFVVDLPGKVVARCNPITAPKPCRSEWLENPPGLRSP
jgi:hypothetical protein